MVPGNEYRPQGPLGVRLLCLCLQVCDWPALPIHSRCKGVLPPIWPNDSSTLSALAKGDIGVKLGQEIQPGQSVSLGELS